MNIQFEQLSENHQHAVMNIFNYYVCGSFAAYPEYELPVSFFSKFLEIAENYPAYVLRVSSDEIIGFGLLRPYNPFSVFKKTAELSYFIHHEFVGQGIGKLLLQKLESDAKNAGVLNFTKKMGLFSVAFLMR